MIDYGSWIKKTDSELIYEYLDGEKGSESSENAKFILETRNAHKLSGYSESLVKVTNGLKIATWVLGIFTLLQVAAQFANMFRN
jgi:hypothetical protein